MLRTSHLTQILIFFGIGLIISTNSIAQSPRIQSVNPLKGTAYTTVTITGSEFTGATQVHFDTSPALCFYASPSGAVLYALAPGTAKSGKISISTPRGSALSADSFIVLSSSNPASDFLSRDSLPQTSSSETSWCTRSWNLGWGPRSQQYPKITFPVSLDPQTFAQSRALASALHCVGLPYQHHHIPAFDARLCTAQPDSLRVGPGLDCSNFSAWVYNYGFGLIFTSHIVAQAADSAAGPLIQKNAPLLPGDILFFKGNPTDTIITHCGIFVDSGHIIDSHNTGVYLRSYSSTRWPGNSFGHARRPLKLLDKSTNTSLPKKNSTQKHSISHALDFYDMRGRRATHASLQYGIYIRTQPDVSNNGTPRIITYLPSSP